MLRRLPVLPLVLEPGELSVARRFQRCDNIRALELRADPPPWIS